MEVERIEDGLWRWLAVHPEWKAGEGWEPHVGCVYWEGPDAVVLIDPQLPPDGPDRERFLEVLDRDVERVGGPLVVLITCSWHVRSSVELAERYGGRIVSPENFADITLPTGVHVISTPVTKELVYWLEDARTLVPGDSVLGDPEGGLMLAPAGWVGSDELSETLRLELLPVLDFPVERVLVSHGEPVLSGGHAALVQALA